MFWLVIVHSGHSFGEQAIYFSCSELHFKSLNLWRQARFLGLYCATLKCLWSELLITGDACSRSPRFYNDSTENCEINSRKSRIRWSAKRARWMRSTTPCSRDRHGLLFSGNAFMRRHKAEKLFRAPFQDLQMDPCGLTSCQIERGGWAFKYPLEQMVENEAQSLNIF